MSEFNITGLLTQSFVGRTSTGEFTWVIIKSIKKNPCKDKHKLDLSKKLFFQALSYTFTNDFTQCFTTDCSENVQKYVCRYVSPGHGAQPTVSAWTKYEHKGEGTVVGHSHLV